MWKKSWAIEIGKKLELEEKKDHLILIERLKNTRGIQTSDPYIYLCIKDYTYSQQFTDCYSVFDGR